MQKLRQILVIFNLKTVIVTTLAVVSICVCRKFESNAEKFIERLDLK